MKHIEHRLRKVEARTLAQGNEVKGAHIVYQHEDEPESIAAAEQQIGAILEQDSSAQIARVTFVRPRHADSSDRTP